MDKFNSFKIKNFYLSRESKGRQEDPNHKNVFDKYMRAKRLVSGICKRLLQINKKKRQPNIKMGKRHD